MSAFVVFVALQAAAAGSVPSSVESAATAQLDAAPEVTAPRAGPRVGVHLGLNATAAVDLEVGKLFYGEFATQLTGLGAAFAPNQGFVLSAFVMGGVTLPLVDRPSYRLQFDVGPHVTLLRSAPVNMLAAGLVAGIRWVHSNGLTLSLKLPVAGYAGSLDQPRGSVLYYYVAAVPTLPALMVGYTF